MVEKYPDNVIPLPIKAKISKQSEDEKVQSKGLWIEGLMEDIFPVVTKIIGDANIDMKDDDFITDYSLVVEAMRSTLCRSFNMTHGLQDFADEHFRDNPYIPTADYDDDDEGPDLA